MKVPDWCVIDTTPGEGHVLCQRCRERERLPVPASLTTIVTWMQYFGERHLDCQEMKAQ